MGGNAIPEHSRDSCFGGPYSGLRPNDSAAWSAVFLI